jgi:ABC-type multidrug transport system fused ATPase/permease subunit
MTSRVLRAPMSYFETTPLGRIINRFTYDVEVLDIELSVSMTGLMISSSWLISSVVVMVRTALLFTERVLILLLAFPVNLTLSRCLGYHQQIAVLPWLALVLMPVSIMYFFIQLFYRMSGPDLQRIDAVTRSPLQATLAEGTSGAHSDWLLGTRLA